MTEPLLQVRGLRKAFGALLVSNDLNLDLHRGEIHALIGPNGAGKTTALAQLSGQVQPDAGTITLEGRDVTKVSMPERAGLGVARSFQITAVLLEFTVLENVALAVQARAKHHFHFWRDARRDKRLTDEARDLLERVGLTEQAYTRAANLSHGQRRQLELAMALATRPKVLLLDEPMAGMGPSETERMARLIETVKQDYATLLVEHDMDVVFSLADRVSVLVYGTLLATGSPSEVRANSEVQRAYLNEEA